jgi:outer membrane immunogenic protein
MGTVMKVRARFLTTTAPVLLAAAVPTAAPAADFKAPVRPVPVPAPIGWTGIYFGGSAGGTWLRSSGDSTAGVAGAVNSIFDQVAGCCAFGPFEVASLSGVGSSATGNGVGGLVGLQAGFNLQHGNFVWGGEADISWVDVKTSRASASVVNLAAFGNTYGYNALESFASKVSALATFRGRVGIDFSSTLAYITAGLALGRIKNTWTYSNFISTCGGCGEGVTLTGFGEETKWVPGLAVGGGIEHKFNQQWSFKGELLWIKFKDHDINGTITQTTTFNPTPHAYSASPITFSNDMVLGRIGLNYHFF